MSTIDAGLLFKKKTLTVIIYKYKDRVPKISINSNKGCGRVYQKFNVLDYMII